MTSTGHCSKALVANPEDGDVIPGPEGFGNSDGASLDGASARDSGDLLPAVAPGADLDVDVVCEERGGEHSRPRLKKIRGEIDG